jgi:integrase
MFNNMRVDQSAGAGHKHLAGLAEREVQLRIAKGEYLGIYEDRKLGFKEFSDQYLEWSKANKTARSHERDIYSIKALAPFFTGTLAAISTEDVEAYKAGRIEEVKSATVNREVACLRHLLNLAVRWGGLGANPVKGVRMLKEPPGRLRYLSEEEIRRLLGACSPRLRPIVVCALNIGKCKGELLDLGWSNVNLKERRILVRASKTNDFRTIPVNDTLLRELKKLPRHLQVDYLFWSRHKGGKRYIDVGEAFENALTRANIADFRFHDLRHTFASHLAMRGVSLRAIAQLLGHKSLQMVMRYSHLSPEHLQGAVGVLDGLLVPRDRHQVDTGGQTSQS